MLAQGFLGLTNAALAVEKHQNITGTFQGQLVHRIQQRTRQITITIVIIPLHRAIAHLHWIGAPFHRQDLRAVEMLAEALHIQRGRGHDQLEFRTLGQQAL